MQMGGSGSPQDCPDLLISQMEIMVSINHVKQCCAY